MVAPHSRQEQKVESSAELCLGVLVRNIFAFYHPALKIGSGNGDEGGRREEMTYAKENAVTLYTDTACSSANLDVIPYGSSKEGVCQQLGNTLGSVGVECF